MKKCNRCGSVIDWDKPFCPLCGGFVTDVTRPPKTEPSAPAVVEKISFAQREPAPVSSLTRAAVPPLAPPVPPAPLSTSPPSFAQAAASVPPAPLPTVSPPMEQIQTPSIPVAPSGEIRVPEAPLPPSVPQAGVFSQIHQTPGISVPQMPPAPAETISQIHQPAAGTPPPQSPQGGGFFSQIHQSPSYPAPGIGFSEYPSSALPQDGGAYAPNPNAGFPDVQRTDSPRAAFQDLTNVSEASLDNALEALLRSGPPLDFSPPPAPSAQNVVIPDLPDDQPKGRALDDEGDFLKMFPGAGG